MKKYIAILAMALTATTALAQHHGHRHHNHYRGYYGGSNWVAPLIIGGSIGYILNRPTPVVIEQPPVYVQPQPQVIQPQCTRYIYQDQNGQTIREEVRCN